MTAKQKQAQIGCHFAIDRYTKLRRFRTVTAVAKGLARGPCRTLAAHTSELVFKPVAMLPAFNHDLHRAREPGQRAGAGIGNDADA
jgi:hypothetical protein